MTRTSWEITLCWIKAHTGIIGNELADILVKKATSNESLTEDYNRIPKKRTDEREIRRKREEMAKKLDKTTKGNTTKEYFPNVEDRLKMKINLTQNLAAVVTGHGKTKA